MRLILKKEVGFTLIEVLLASALSLLLLSILITIYLASVRSLQLQESLNHVEENAKVTLEILSTEIKKAGYIGCARLTSDFPINHFFPFSITSQNKLSGKNAELTVRYADFPTVSLIKPTDQSAVLYTSNNLSFKPDNILIISDCHHAEIFKVKKINSYQSLQKIIATSPLHSRFSPDAEVSRLVMNKYFIGKTTKKYANEDSNYSLFVENISHHKTELVNGIDKIALRFSVMQDGTMIDLPAKAIDDWSAVLGVLIKLELSYRQLKRNLHLYVAKS